MSTEMETYNELIEEARSTLAELLPPGWQVDLSRGPAQDEQLEDERFTVSNRSGGGRSLLVDARLRATPAELDNAYSDSLGRRIRADAGSSILVVAPYLSPRSRTILDEAGVNYLDLTGNIRIVVEYPGLAIRTEGAQRDPTPRKRPERGISGPAARRVVRALADVTPPYSVSELAELAWVSPGYCSRTLQALEREAFIRRDSRGTVAEVDWPAMLRRRGNAVHLFDQGRTKSYVARTSAQRVLENLADLDTETYAVTGSFAAARLRAVAAPAGLTVYARQVNEFAALLPLTPADQGAEVRLLRPPDDGVFDRSKVADGTRWVAPSQIVLDCLGGTGRMPQEGEAVLEWMIEHESDWRISSGEIT